MQLRMSLIQLSKITIVVALLITLTTTSPIVDPKSNGRTEAPEWLYLGTIHGKSFYLDHSVAMNWTDALAYCAESRFELAAIATAEEARFLVETIRANNITGFMWTSGRQYLMPGAFIWHGRAEQPKKDALIHWRDRNIALGESYYFCLHLNVRTNVPQGFDFSSDSCAINFHVLCQQ